MSTSLQALDTLSPGRDVDAYIQTVNSISVLTQQEEQDLGRAFHEHQDLDAARRLVISHLRFVVHVARSYSGYGLQTADLIQEGNIGLMKAVKRFDPDYGVRLVSFAVHWVRAEIHEFILRNWRIVKVATTKAQRKLFFNLRGAKKRLGWLTQDEAKAVANDLGVSPETVTQMEGRLYLRDAAFDGVDADDDDDFQASPAQFLRADTSDPADEAANDEWREESEAKLHLALSELDERSRDIVGARWLSDKKSTLHELAAKYEISAERIRQLEQAAMKKMRKQIAA